MVGEITLRWDARSLLDKRRIGQARTDNANTGRVEIISDPVTYSEEQIVHIEWSASKTLRPVDYLALPRVSYRGSREVESFLAQNPEIESFLEAAWLALTKHFGETIEVVLEVLTYPEAGSSSELVGWIQSTDDVYTGLEKLERFKDEWFLEHMAEVDGKFNFNIENR
jgi:hypothetical protein